MASHIKRGESLFIPFREGLSISDSQLRPRIYKSTEQFEKHFPGYYKGTAGVELVEYAEVVRCKDCVHMKEQFNARYCEIWCMFNGMGDEGFCNYGERKDGDQS